MTDQQLQETSRYLRAAEVRETDRQLRERAEAVGIKEGFWPGAPDLAIEVVSPSETFANVEEKVLDWLGAGTRMVVVVSPAHRLVTVYRSKEDVSLLGEEAEIDGGDVVPGWRFPVREIFG